MRDLPALDGDVEELDGRGSERDPGARRLPHALCFAGDRVGSSRCAPAARPTRSCTRRAAASFARCGQRARRARTELDARGRAAPRLDAPRTARRRSRASRATGSTATPSSRSSRRSRRRRRPHLARRARAAARVRRPGRVHRLPARRGAARCGASSPRRRTCSSSAAPSTRRRRGATWRRARAAGLALRLHGDQFTESGAIPLAIELGARSVDHLEATGPEGVRALAASDVTGVLLPASALFLARPMPPARALVDAGAAVALATDFNPGSAFCESLPLVCSLACTQLHMAPEEALAACTVNAAHVLGRADRIGPARPRLPGRPRAARRARLAPSRLPPGRRRRAHVVEGGAVAWRARHNRPWPREAAAPPREGEAARVRDRLRRRARATRSSRTRPRSRPASEEAARAASGKTAARASELHRVARGRAPQPPSWQRVAKRGAHLRAALRRNGAPARRQADDALGAPSFRRLILSSSSCPSRTSSTRSCGARTRRGTARAPPAKR